MDNEDHGADNALTNIGKVLRLRRNRSRYNNTPPRPSRRQPVPSCEFDYEGPSITLTPSISNRHHNNNSNNNNQNEDESSNSDTNEDPLRNAGHLYSFARAWAWPALAHRSGTHPWEAGAEIVNSDGDTVLHWAVFGNPPSYVIEALLQACPDLVNAANSAGHLPLHVACCYRASVDTLRALIEVNPATLTVRNGSGSYPLHILCDSGCRPECLQVVLQYHQAVPLTITDQDRMYGRSPLYILNQRKNLATFGGQVEELRRLRQHQRDAIQHGNWTDSDQATLEVKVREATETELWRKARMLILAEFTQYHQQQCFARRSRQCLTTVQACLGIDQCPPSLLEYAILAYSEEMTIPDENGNLPLHQVCSIPVQRRDGQWLMLEVLDANVQAAKVLDGQRRSPLEMYLHSSRGSTVVWSEALRRLILAHPVALNNLQIDRRLYPLILERLVCRRDTASGMFELIKANPGLFSGFANDLV